MSMSRKDFELIARTLKDLRQSNTFFGGKEPLIDIVTERLATALDGHVATFQKDRFVAACKPKGQS